MPHFHLVTLFPEFFDSPLKVSLLGKATKQGLIQFSFHNPREFGTGPHKHVDDRPFGGGPGMIMQLEPILKTLETIPHTGKILLMTATGKPFNQELAKNLSTEQDITIICGRYEGVDSRLSTFAPIVETSVGQIILNGGETAALAVIEAVSRFIPEFMGKEESAKEESFSDGLLEYPQYTRPENYLSEKVPEVLLSGNHEKISQWRRQNALQTTLEKNPALLENAKLSEQDSLFLKTLPRSRHGKNLCFCLCHNPVILEKNKSGCSSLTNLDIHDIARISRSYGLGPFFVLHPYDDQRRLLLSILEHWQKVPESHADRKRALEHVQAVKNFNDVENFCIDWFGKSPIWIVTSANWPKKNNACVSFGEIRELCAKEPVVICLGTAKGLSMPELPIKYLRLAPVRHLDENHLSVRSAAAIIADRILGDYF